MNEANKRWTRFSLRDLFWLVLVVALAVGWWRDRTKLAEERNKAIVEVRERMAFANLVQERGAAQIVASDTALQSKIMELMKLRYAIRQLDQATQDRLQGLMQNSPKTDETEPREVGDPSSKVDD